MEKNKYLLSKFRTNKQYSRMILNNNNDFELALIAWDKNATSGLHKHETDCNFILLEGNLFETKYSINQNLIETKDIEPGETSFLPQGNYHNIFNVDHDKSLSLHIYDNINMLENNYNFALY